LVEFDKSILDVEYDMGTYEITEEDIIRFSKAHQEVNPVFYDAEAAAESRHGGLIAPPAFFNQVVLPEGYPDIKIEHGSLELFAGQELEQNRPMRPGDVITVKSKIADVYEKTGRSGKMVFMVREATYTDQKGEVVAVVRSTMLQGTVDETASDQDA
jgi:acyl dehydratase